MRGLSDLTALVPPPATPYEAADGTTWAATQDALGVSLPADLFELGAAYGSGKFLGADGQSYRLQNPGSKWFMRQVKIWQPTYTELKAQGVHRPFPGDLYPTDPGLLWVGCGDSRIALFIGLKDRRSDGMVAALTFQETWLHVSSGFIPFFVAVLRGQIDLWGTPEARSGAPWAFQPDVPATPEELPPLVEAVLLDDLTRVRALSRAGADPNRGGRDGETPLCITDDEAMVRLLLELGADPNLPNRMGRRPLTLACSSHLPLGGLRALLEAGADPNQTDSFGCTPLALLCSFKGPEEVELLLQFGANPNAVSGDGRTPMQIARKRPDVQQVLRAGGAR